MDPRPGVAAIFRPNLRILDVTLCEGYQASEVALTVDEEVAVAILPEEIGVPAAQVGFAG